MKKILLLIPALNAGGAERTMVTLANEWSKDNDITILTFFKSKPFYALNNSIKLERMNLPLPKNKIKRLFLIPIVELKRYKYLVNKVKNGNYDFIMSFTNIANLMVSMLSKNSPKQYCIISERNDPSRHSKLFGKAAEKYFRKADLLICQNDMVKKYFKEKGFENQLVVLPNPVDFSYIPTERPRKIEKAISTVGRLVEQKNHRLLIGAFSEVHKKYPEYVLKIFGTGPLEGALKQQAKTLGIERFVLFMGTKDKVMREVNKTEIFVLPSKFEGFPNALIEAMATGMPVISSRFATGIADRLIIDGKNGFLFDVDDKEGLEKAIASLLSKREEYSRIEKNNRRIASEYRSDIVAANWLYIIDRQKTRKADNNNGNCK